jgi:aryl-alcohol dehydrogenase-like predicted oxidoreductase
MGPAGGCAGHGGGEMETLNKVGNTDVEVFPLVLGGHSVSRLPDKTMPDDDEAIAILHLLVSRGVTHFDCTWKEERQAFDRLLEKGDLKSKIQPIMWHGWHGREERTADDVVEAIGVMLSQLGYDKGSMIILNQWEQWEHADERKHYYSNEDHAQGFADWFFEGFARAKQLGLVDAIGWGVEPGPLNAEFLYRNHERFDFIVSYWNYRMRQNQFLVEFARDHHMGVYAVAPFGRGQGSIFKMEGIDHQKLLRPWLKWVSREPSVFAMPISLPNLEEARATSAVFDGLPMSAEEALFLQQLPTEIRLPSRDP